jgi:hypothetical protein
MAHQSLQLHDGNITVAIDPEQSMVIMQIDEKKDSQPFIFDLANHTLSNVTVYPPVGEYAPSSGPIALAEITAMKDQINDLRNEIINIKALLASNESQGQSG